MNRIAVVTIATSNLNYRKYSNNNAKNYCGVHGYDFKLYEEKLDPDAAAITNKTIAVLENIDDYDWIFMKDADSLFCNFNLRIEQYLDDDYNYIASWSKMGEVNLGHLLIKCTPEVKNELTNIVLPLLRERIVLKGEQPVYNELWNTKKISPVKVLDKHILNAHPIGKKNWGEWLTWEEFEARVQENRNYEKYSDISADSFIVHYPGTFMKTRNEYTEHHVNVNEGKDMPERWNFSDSYLKSFVALHDEIQRRFEISREMRINNKQPSNLSYGKPVRRHKRRKIKYKK